MHLAAGRCQHHLHALPMRLLRPFVNYRLHRGIEWHRVAPRQQPLLARAGHVQHVVDDARNAVRILFHDGRELSLYRIGEVFAQQGAGLRDGRQRIADLVCDGRRHAAHGRQLFRADARLQFAQVLQEHDAQALVA